ncbi:DNA polymerase alpha/epsilon subunit B-domain-containing protein [Phlyctochytrium arcticum]|nr:DNA polymerase alpha/epsilon subunit B-domain-containing protein [Phlyctochytrium arcticum]
MLTALNPSSIMLDESAQAANDPVNSTLLSSPDPNQKSDEEDLVRQPASVIPTWESFIVKKREYTQQYAGMYFVRLNMMRSRVLAAAEQRWAKPKSGAIPPHIPRALDVKPGEICYIAGTIYMDMPLKPNILDEVTREHWVVAPPPRVKYASEEDQVVLEDESGRIKLTGNLLKSLNLVTGIVVGVLGAENSGGEFEVVDICYPAMKPQPPLTASTATNDEFIVLASGLDVGTENFSLELEMLTDYLTGELGSLDDQRTSAKITRLILAGNTVAPLKTIEDDKRTKTKYGQDMLMVDKEPLEAVDTLLAEICANLEVDILPGKTDPANCSLPQQPIHIAIFPKAARYSTYHSVTNPYSADIDGLCVLGSAGQTIDDIFRYLESEERLAMAENTITWAHLAPTAPDTLWCHPYKDNDPFVIKQRPHLYFIGNQPSYETSLMTDPQTGTTRVILIPSFSQTKSVVLVNTRTLEPHLVTFNGQFTTK